MEVVSMSSQVVDLFCGIGGLTKGLSNVGLNVVDGFDIDRTCEYTYSQNNTANFHYENI